MNNNQFPPNPFLVHKIQDHLHTLSIAAFDHLSMAIVAYRTTAIKPLIKILHKEEREKVISIIGKECMNWIDEYMEGEDTPDDLPSELFTHQK